MASDIAGFGELPEDIIRGEIMERMDPFDLSKFLTANKVLYEEALHPEYWIRLYEQVPPGGEWGPLVVPEPRRMKKPERLVMPGAHQVPLPADPEQAKQESLRRENEIPLPTLEQMLKPGEVLADINPDSPSASVRVKANARIFGSYSKTYAKAWILNQYPRRTFKLGDIDRKYKSLLNWWYLSNKGFTMHSTIKDNTKLIIPYWDPRKVVHDEMGAPTLEPGYNGTIARVDFGPGDVYRAVTYNTTTNSLEDLPVPQIVPNVRFVPRRSDPNYVNIMTMEVPTTTHQLTELTGYRNHDFSLNFVNIRDRDITSWDVMKVLLSPGDLQTLNIRAWSTDPIPDQEDSIRPYALPRSTGVQRDIDGLRAFIRREGTESVRAIVSEMAFILNTLRKP